VFANLRNATVSYARSVGLPVGPHGTARLPLDGFSLYLVFEHLFGKMCREIQVSLKSDRNSGILRDYQRTFMGSSLNTSQNEEYFIQKLYKKIKTRF